MRFFVVIALLCALSPVVSGCTEDTSTPLAVCVAHGKQMCRALFTCCAEGERADYNAFTLFGSAVEQESSEEECLTAWTERCENETIDVDGAVADGLRTFDATRAAGCIERTRTAVDVCNAEGFLVPDTNCATVAPGTVQNGLECNEAAECAEAGSVCIERVCVRPGEDGFACTTDNDCNRARFACRASVCTALSAADEVCAVDADCLAVTSCLGGLCAVLPQLGADCDPFAVRGCIPGTFCDDRDNFDGVGECKASGDEGAECRDDRECNEPFFCNRSLGLPVCVDDGGNGDECDVDGQCNSNFCDPVALVCSDPNGANVVTPPDLTSCNGI